ncbi:MAG: RNA polymerase sigma factor [Myxococcota bacterium]
MSMPRLRVVSSPASLPEDDEIKAIAKRDRRTAADWIVRKYRDPIFQHAAWILKDWEEAIDVAQDVFIKAMREKRFFDPDFKMKAWLYRVTSNLCFNLVRDRRRRSAILEAAPRSELLPRATSDEPEQTEVVFANEQQKRIMHAIDRLTEAHREILLLRYYSDLSYAEISDTLGIKLGTVMSRLSRARGALVEVLDAQGVEMTMG